VLLGVAQSYNKVIEYKPFAEAIQHTTDIFTGGMLPNWIGDVLEPIAKNCHELGEPLLTALVVRTTGDVGDGYDRAIGVTYRTFRGLDREQHAAEERLLCYLRWSLDLPPQPVARLTPKYKAKVDRQTGRTHRRNEAVINRQICPVCHTTKSMSGSCLCD
jgi:hypothetical protein